MAEKNVNWITTKEAAKLAGVTEQRIRQLCGAGKLNCRKFGRVWQVDKLSVQPRAVRGRP